MDSGGLLLLAEIYYAVVWLAVIALFYAFIYALQNYLGADNKKTKKAFALVSLLDVFAIMGLLVEGLGLWI